VRSAVEEGLRYDGTVQFLQRIAPSLVFRGLESLPVRFD
jgi:hypothetical protein